MLIFRQASFFHFQSAKLPRRLVHCPDIHLTVFQIISGDRPIDTYFPGLCKKWILFCHFYRAFIHIHKYLFPLPIYCFTILDICGFQSFRHLKTNLNQCAGKKQDWDYQDTVFLLAADSFYTEFPFNSMSFLSFHRNAPSSIYTILSA